MATVTFILGRFFAIHLSCFGNPYATKSISICGTKPIGKSSAASTILRPGYLFIKHSAVLSATISLPPNNPMDKPCFDASLQSSSIKSTPVMRAFTSFFKNLPAISTPIPSGILTSALLRMY